MLELILLAGIYLLYRCNEDDDDDESQRRTIKSLLDKIKDDKMDFYYSIPIITKSIRLIGKLIPWYFS